MTAELDIPGLRALYERATKGPWRFDHDWHRCPMISGAGRDIVYIQKIGSPEQEANAAFIVAAHEHWDKLLSSEERAQRAEAALRDAFELAAKVCLWASDTIGAAHGSSIDSALRFAHDEILKLAAIRNLTINTEGTRNG